MCYERTCIHSSLNDWDGRNAALGRRSVGFVCEQRGDVLMFAAGPCNTQVTSSDDDTPVSSDGGLPRNERRVLIVYCSENVENCHS